MYLPPMQPAINSPSAPSIGILGLTNSVNPCLDAQFVACHIITSFEMSKTHEIQAKKEVLGATIQVNSLDA